VLYVYWYDLGMSSTVGSYRYSHIDYRYSTLHRYLLVPYSILSICRVLYKKSLFRMFSLRYSMFFYLNESANSRAPGILSQIHVVRRLRQLSGASRSWFDVAELENPGVSWDRLRPGVSPAIDDSGVLDNISQSIRYIDPFVNIIVKRGLDNSDVVHWIVGCEP
jgi:hypothetical protein